MKQYKFFYILTCMFCFFYISACEKTTLQSTGNDVTDKDVISNRTVDDCEDCPNEDDCCCSAELQNPSGSSVTLRFCGTSDGASACSGSPVGPCPSFSGGGQQFTLSTGAGNFRKAFCMVPGNTFWIFNASSTLNADIYLSCQNDLIGPQILTLSIPPLTAWTYTTDSGCELTLCED